MPYSRGGRRAAQHNAPRQGSALPAKGVPDQSLAIPNVMLMQTRCITKVMYNALLTHTLTPGTKGEVYLTLFPFLTAPESGICANVSHSLTESMLFRECGVLRGPQRVSSLCRRLPFLGGRLPLRATSEGKRARKNSFGKVVPLDVFFCRKSGKVQKTCAKALKGDPK